MNTLQRRFSKKPKTETFENVIDGLKTVYKNKLLPLETEYAFHDFHSPPLDDIDFELASEKSTVLLVGQYSTGKTSFIRFLLEENFPGMLIGPEPTTDSFVAVMHNEETNVIPGHVLVADETKNFRTLSKFGGVFLDNFQCSQLSNERLKKLTFIDTPGILAANAERGYNYGEVLEWFADRCDIILLLFDAHQLDFSDEFKRIVEVLKKNEKKIRIVLNKADMVDGQSLIKLHSALMWSLSRVLTTPEVVRVYMGSFKDGPLLSNSFGDLFERESKDLLNDLLSLHRNSLQRILNDLIRRARLAKVHAYLISELKNEMPLVFFKGEKKRKLIENLDEIYLKVQKKYNIHPNDLPNVVKMTRILKETDFSKLKALDETLITNIDIMLNDDVPRLVRMLPKEEKKSENKTIEMTFEVTSTVETQKPSPVITVRRLDLNSKSDETDPEKTPKKSSHDRLSMLIN